MAWLLKFLIFGHVHKWTTIHSVQLTLEGRPGVRGSRWIQQCEHCGKVRCRDFL